LTQFPCRAVLIEIGIGKAVDRAGRRITLIWANRRTKRDRARACRGSRHLGAVEKQRHVRSR